jgi:uncharacterized membrane protein
MNIVLMIIVQYNTNFFIFNNILYLLTIYFLNKITTLPFFSYFYYSDDLGYKIFSFNHKWFSNGTKSKKTHR